MRINNTRHDGCRHRTYGSEGLKELQTMMVTTGASEFATSAGSLNSHGTLANTVHGVYSLCLPKLISLSDILRQVWRETGEGQPLPA